VNIGNQTSVKSGDILHIEQDEHRTTIRHRYGFGSRRHSAAWRDPEISDFRCQGAWRWRDRGGVDKVQAIEWWPRVIDGW